MGQVKSCISTTLGKTQEKVLSVLCPCRKGNAPGAAAAGGKYRYGSLASGGKYDESDDEDVRGMLYNNNLLLDDDDDEEEQIVIITRDKTEAKPEQRSQQTTMAAAPVDHSVFKEGQGLLDLTPAQPDPASSSFDQMMQRMQVEEKHDSAVNEVMGEIEDQLEDSEEDDTAFLVTSNSGTGEQKLNVAAAAPDYNKLEEYAATGYEQQQHQEYDYSNQQTNYYEGAENGSSAHYDQSQQPYDASQQHDQWQYQDNAQANQYAPTNTYEANAHNQDAEDLMAELDDAVGSDDDGLI